MVCCYYPSETLNFWNQCDNEPVLSFQQIWECKSGIWHHFQWWRGPDQLGTRRCFEKFPDQRQQPWRLHHWYEHNRCQWYVNILIEVVNKKLSFRTAKYLTWKHVFSFLNTNLCFPFWFMYLTKLQVGNG